MVFGHFTASAYSDDNIFRVKILNRLLNFFSVWLLQTFLRVYLSTSWLNFPLTRIARMV